MNLAREQARGRGDAFKLRLLETLDWLSLEEAAAQSDCPVAELYERAEAGDLIAVEHNHRVLVPAIQLSDGRLLPHLCETLHAMALESPWLRVSWLISTNERLGGASPLESLNHDPDAVLSAARGVGIQGGG